MKKLLFMAAAVLAAAVFFLLVALPPWPIALPVDGVDQELLRRTVRGAYHIHTTRSDGAGSKNDIAAAASRAGLQFAIFTDHGDGTRTPDPPAYLSGVLCIDSAEISTNGGHYVALDLSPPPYPLGGEAAAVVEDVRRLGGFGIVAHPDHPNRELAWNDWTAPVDGIEWLNADAEWRMEQRLELTKTLFTYLVRPGPSVASVFDRPEQTLERWDAASRSRRIVALAAVDAHGGAWMTSGEKGESRVIVGPSYDAEFSAVSNRLVLAAPLTGDASNDARAVIDAIKAGRAYSVVDAISPDVVVSLDPSAIRPASRLPSWAEAVTVNGERGQRLEIRAAQAPGDPPIPWVLTNWTYPGGDPVPSAGTPQPIPQTSAPVSGEAWTLEKDPVSIGRLNAREGTIALDFELAGGPRGNQYVAIAVPMSQSEPFDSIAFQGRASRPMRISVQLRFPDAGRRWVKSVYLDPQGRDVVVRTVEMIAADPPHQPMPPPASARSLLFVMDLVNAHPGDKGEFQISNVRVVR